MNVLVTGASGFVGSCIYNRLAKDDRINVIGTSRNGGDAMVRGPSLNSEADWSETLQGVDVVIHSAAMAHILGSSANISMGDFREVNVDGTLALAKQAYEAGVNRFVFMSSIGVNGNRNTVPFTEHDTPRPTEPYARSKWEAEEELKKLSSETGMEVVIIRSPLVYGPEAPGNLGLLAKVAKSGLPLPLKGIRNRRSFVSLWNLVDFVVRCIDHPEASGETFVVADGEDISTSELLRKLAHAADKPSRLFWLPAPLLKAGAMALGKRGVYDRLFDSLQVDASHARHTLDWLPPLNLDEGLRRCFCHQDESRTL